MGGSSPADAFESKAMADCPRLYTQAQHGSFARRAYGRPKITRAAQKRVLRLRSCQHSLSAGRNAKKLTRVLRARYKLRKLTPYNCGSHGWFAIPCYIVQCESKFDWGAYNPSGAMGAYQLLGWVSRGASREAQHRMAAKLWSGGAGASHWVCA